MLRDQAHDDPVGLRHRLFVGPAAALLIAAAFAFANTDLAGRFTDAGAVAAGLAQTVGPVAGALFAIFLLDAAIIGAAAVTLATTYAFGDVFGIRHSLHRGIGEAKGFYGSYSLLVALALVRRHGHVG